MAVKKCCVENCKSCSTRKEDQGVTFHKFPKDVTSRNEWQHITHYKNPQKDLTAYVCSRHFCKGDFQKNMDSRYILKSDAVPSIFPWTIEKINMDDTSTTEETLNISDDDDKTLSFDSKMSDVENLEAIKKFIEEQEKEILESEIQEKEIQEKKLLEEKYIEKELCKQMIGNKFQETNKADKSGQDVDAAGHIDVASSVIDMIINEPEAEIRNKTADESAKDVLEQSVRKTAISDHNTTSPIDKGNASMSLAVGSKVEVKDFGGDWYEAEIAEVDYDDMEVLVRYETEWKKHDEWISVSSPRLRPFTGAAKKPPAPGEKDSEEPKDTKPLKDKAPAKDQIVKEKLLAPKEIKEESKDDVKVEEKPKVVFEVGERCLARWRDNRRFVATILKDLGDGKFEILFDDGFHWTCPVGRLNKLKADSLSIDTSFQAASAGSPSPLETSGPSTDNAPISPSIPVFHTHLFDPARDYLGSKSERREKKRKLNIKEIFNIGQKKTKIAKSETDKSPKTQVEKKPRVVRKKVTPSTPKSPSVVPKKEIKTELPDAVASIIGTVTKELEVKLEPLSSKTYAKADTNQRASEMNDDVDSNADESITEDIKEEVDDNTMDDMGPISCVVNPNDKTLDDEDSIEEPKSEGDPVLEEEVKLENFEKQDTEKHERVIDKIKEAIIKLEGGISAIEKLHSPKVERNFTPIKDLEASEEMHTPELKAEVKKEHLKDVLAEVAAIIDDGVSNTEEKEGYKSEFSSKEKPKLLKPKRDHLKLKKGKKLRLLQQKRVKRQVEKVKNELERMKKQFEAMRRQMMVQTQGLAQSPVRAAKVMEPLPEEYLLPGEWCCHWVNGQPVGKVSEIEGGAAHVGADNKPALPRRSVQVDDKRLPAGWTKHMVRRSVGHSAGKWNVVLVGPEELKNKRFHTKTDMRNFLESSTGEALKEYQDALLDFGVHLKTARRMGWIVNTPDGIAEAPETILPADTTCTQSPLVKIRKLKQTEKEGRKRTDTEGRKRKLVRKDGDRKRSLMMHKKRRPIKLKLQRGLDTYNSQLLGGESSGEIKSEPMDNAFEPPLLPLEDGYVYVGSLKVQIIDTLLRCPAESCFKNFRTKTLLQMHIKHYHRELKAMMGATPKVLDLAYARTMPGDVELPQIDKKVIKVKINRPPRREESKMITPEMEMPMDYEPETPDDTENCAPIIPRIPRSQDSPKLRQALIHKPVKRPRVLLPVRRLEPEQAIPDSMNNDVFENTNTEPIVEIPVIEHPLDFETAISTHTVTKPLEKKKKMDKKKSFALFSKNVSEDEEWFAMNSDDPDTRSSFPRSGSPDSKMDTKMAPMSSESNDDQKDANLYTYIETGERVKIVHMKREEIINCHCGIREEDGLMVQCELCLCWQHALCHNIQRECEVPEKYTCSICLNPRRGRRSQRFLHDQDRMYEGLLPGAKPCEALRRSHELTGNLLRVDDALHALRVKYYVATKKDHPKLYLWAKDWEQAEITYTQEKLNSDYSDLNVMINGMDKENLPIKHEDVSEDIRTPPSEEQDHDRLSQRDNQLGSQALLSGLLSSPGGASLDLPISTSELERLAKTVQAECGEWERAATPQPEAAIEDGACRARLLAHIQRCQALLDTRLDSIEAQVAELESQDPSFGEHYETAEFYPRTKQTIQMLMRDLDTMEELGVIT